MTETFGEYLLKINDVGRIKKGIDYIIKFRSFIPEQYKSFTDPAFKGALDKISTAKPGEVADYIKTVFK